MGGGGWLLGVRDGMRALQSVGHRVWRAVLVGCCASLLVGAAMSCANGCAPLVTRRLAVAVCAESPPLHLGEGSHVAVHSLTAPQRGTRSAQSGANGRSSEAARAPGYRRSRSRCRAMPASGAGRLRKRWAPPFFTALLLYYTRPHHLPPRPSFLPRPQD